jgi:anti-sigma factor RsiW
MNRVSECRPEIVQAYADAELSLSEALQIERHLEICDACKTSCRNQKALSAAIADCSLYHPAPKGIRARLERELFMSDEPEIGAIRSSMQRRTEPRWRALALAASAAFVIVLSAGIVGRLNSPVPEDRTEGEVVSDHIRSLMVNHLTDVASTDQHTVKPWFDGKLDFSPQVQDFAANGFPLIGGRIDIINNRPVAALVYRLNKHFINLFVWPSLRGSASEESSSQRGYNVIHWTESGMDCWAISDVNRGNLEDFIKLVRSGH